MTWLVGHFLAVGIGISLGLLGGGGSVLALPILVYFMGVAPKSAIAMTLIIVGTVSLLGTIPHWKRGNINLKTVDFWFGNHDRGLWGSKIGDYALYYGNLSDAFICRDDVIGRRIYDSSRLPES